MRGRGGETKERKKDGRMQGDERKGKEKKKNERARCLMRLESARGREKGVHVLQEAEIKKRE